MGEHTFPKTPILSLPEKLPTPRKKHLSPEIWTIKLKMPD